MNVWFVGTYTITLWAFHSCRSSHQRCFIKIGVLKILAKLTRKHMFQSLFFNKFGGLKVELCQMSVRKSLQCTLQLSNSNFLDLDWIAVIMTFYGFIHDIHHVSKAWYYNNSFQAGGKNRIRKFSDLHSINIDKKLT